MQKTLSLHRHRRTISILSLAVLVAGTILPGLLQSQVNAQQITNRSLTLMAGAADGGSAPGGDVRHEFQFDTNAGGSDIGYITFEYCTTAAPVPDGIDCDAPDGLDVINASLEQESGAIGFSVDTATTTNEIHINRASAGSVAAETTLTYRFSDVTNPSNTNETFFVRITSYNSTDGTGDVQDSGTVAASTATPIELEGIMPESLVFCTGGSIDLAGGVPDCTSATSGSVSFDQLFSPTDTATALSQMAASTNAGQGYAVTVNGPTLTSGNNEIDAMDDGAGGATSLILGTSQFGMNLVANVTTTDVNDDPLGSDVDPAPNGTNYRGDVADEYDIEDMFKFADGDTVATSFDGIEGGTDSQIFTKSYVVNVPGSQPAGTYTTTLTYIATATF